jgi:hypothetical protein
MSVLVIFSGGKWSVFYLAVPIHWFSGKAQWTFNGIVKPQCAYPGNNFNWPGFAGPQ